VPGVSQYPSPFGTRALRRAAAGYLSRRFGVGVDPETQVLACAGAKEAIFHLPLAFAGDPARRKVVIPDPGYPTYEVGTRLAGLEPVKVPLTAARRFLLEPEDVGEATLRETLVFWLNYPHNPTGAVAPLDYLRRVGEAAARYGFVVASDECYADVYFGDPPRSMLEVQVENVVAIHSCSKRSGMTGYRTGFMAGDPDLVTVLRSLRSHPGVASAEFVAAAAAAAWGDDAHPAQRREIFRRKRDLLLGFFAEHGITADASEATLYLWVRVPAGQTGAEYALRLLDEGIVVAPGTAFGEREGHVRVALVPTLDECEEAVRAWSKVRT
jgi:acetylornithine aminotransferase